MQESDGQAAKGITESAGKVTKGKNKRAPVQMGRAGQDRMQKFQSNSM
jgi:hypothetical protein